MSTTSDDTFNDSLAVACQTTCSSCCKKGKIFLPDNQYQKIKDWMSKNSPEDEQEFEARIEAHEGFKLYDQRTSCQFLDEKDLCRLHTQGVKPLECFWWPLHVYPASASEGSEKPSLEIRAAGCCPAYVHITPDSPYVDDVEADVKAIGRETILKFRKVFPGSYYPHLIRTIKPTQKN